MGPLPNRVRGVETLAIPHVQTVPLGERVIHWQDDVRLGEPVVVAQIGSRVVRWRNDVVAFHFVHVLPNIPGVHFDFPVFGNGWEMWRSRLYLRGHKGEGSLESSRLSTSTKLELFQQRGRTDHVLAHFFSGAFCLVPVPHHKERSIYDCFAHEIRDLSWSWTTDP